MMIRFATCFCAMTLGQYVQADVDVRFIEGAPTDRFVISSSAGICEDGPVWVTVDLSQTAGRLIFDVTSGGAGVEVFQPLVFVQGGDLVTGTSELTDGSNVLAVRLAALPAGAEVAFTLDVDDTIGAREITVSGDEFAGATVRVQAGDADAVAAFGAGNAARVPWPACLS